MPAELLILARATPNAPKGALVAVKPAGWIWGARETLPAFCTVTVTGVTFAQVARYVGRWYRRPSLEVVSVSGGVATLRLSSEDVVRADGAGGYTVAEVQSVLTALNAANVVESAGEVTFELSAFGVASSDAFWDRNVSSVVFADLGLSAGVQRVSAGYSGIDPNKVSTIVQAKGGEVVSNDGSTIIFDLTVAGLAQAVREHFAEYRQVVAKHRYRFRSAAVDQVVANGGHMTVTAVQAQTNIVDAAQ